MYIGQQIRNQDHDQQPGSRSGTRWNSPYAESCSSPVEEDQAKEAALRKEAIYKQKIMVWKQSVQAKAAREKANDAKAAEKAAKKKVTKKSTFNNDYEEEQPEGITKPKVTSESKAAPQHRDAQGPKAVTKP